ncbi:Nucleoside-diphosphate-sugar epimerase [Noviherbaspirillum humi]|uniref:Nucleoside-diphosphate-sugar epimerase n=1 Tax=Noviherbaspirillum humi TaxID=1688639 RepID=A0A239JSI6_9BURK|nr:D-erythronate dehydrogenase [Noviherbaspirillum humi]SNT07774.1 Nucleoside-diphosphate-sugar epimerase [Noviherbaspirillum humi]
MEVLITGGAGLLGARLARQLLERGTLADAEGRQASISKITLLDVVPAQGFNDRRIDLVTGDVADVATIERVLTPATESVFHLAAIVSGQAEAEFDLGMRINFDATRLILERARHNGNKPRLVFTSSVAVFGGDLPAQVPDAQVLMPQSSYGAQKAMGELLVTDYSRKGFIDGRALRMPTVCVRPGAPNKAASSFASGIIREPLNGIEAVCPVSPDTPMWLLSPRRAIDSLIHGHDIDAGAFGGSRALSLPGLATTVREMVAALERVAGADVVKRIRWQEDPAIIRIVNTWPGDFITARADAMGFQCDADFDSIVRAYIEDELGGKTAA